MGFAIGRDQMWVSLSTSIQGISILQNSAISRDACFGTIENQTNLKIKEHSNSHYWQHRTHFYVLQLTSPHHFQVQMLLDMARCVPPICMLLATGTYRELTRTPITLSTVDGNERRQDLVALSIYFQTLL